MQMQIVDVTKDSIITVYRDEVRFIHDRQNVDAGIVLPNKMTRLKFARALHEAANLLEQV